MFRCICCGLSCMKRSYIQCQESPDEGGRLCLICAAKIPADTANNCYEWLKILLPSTICDLCEKVESDLLLCGICDSYSCTRCVLYDSYAAWLMSDRSSEEQNFNLIICNACVPPGLDKQSLDNGDKFCILCQEDHDDDRVPDCINPDKQTPLVQLLLDGSFFYERAENETRNFVGVSVSSVNSRKESNQNMIESDIPSLRSIAPSSDTDACSESSYHHGPFGTSSPVASVANLTKASNASQPRQLLSKSSRTYSKKSSKGTSLVSSGNSVGRVRNKKNLNPSPLSIPPNFKDFVNTSVHDACLKISEAQLRNNAEINGMKKQLDKIGEMIAKMSLDGQKGGTNNKSGESATSNKPTMVQSGTAAESGIVISVNGNKIASDSISELLSNIMPALIPSGDPNSMGTMTCNDTLRKAEILEDKFTKIGSISISKLHQILKNHENRLADRINNMLNAKLGSMKSNFGGNKKPPNKGHIKKDKKV